MSYLVTNSNLLINIDGVPGTVHAGESYSLFKANIVKFTKKESTGNIGIVMDNNTDYTFLFSELIDPSTGVAFTTVAGCEQALESYVSNTDSTGVLFSALLTPVVATHICDQRRQGYATLTTPSTNTGVILFGPSTVGANSAQLNPGQSTIIESGNMSLWYVKNITATDVVSVAGEYKG